MINNSSDFDSEDEQSLQGGAHGSHSHSAHGSHSRRRSNKVAYVVFTGRITGVFTEWFVTASFLYICFQLVRSSAEYQVKFFPGCSFKGYTTVDAAISAWDLAVANDMVGIPRSKHSNTTRIVSPTTPSRQAVNSTNVIPTFQPSTPSRQTLQTSATSLFTSSLSPERPATSSTPSTHGSETRLAAIITALNDVDLMSHYVVIRGEKPGVYSSRFVSTVSFFLFF